MFFFVRFFSSLIAHKDSISLLRAHLRTGFKVSLKVVCLNFCYLGTLFRFLYTIPGQTDALGGSVELALRSRESNKGEDIVWI